MAKQNRSRKTVSKVKTPPKAQSTAAGATRHKSQPQQKVQRTYKRVARKVDSKAIATAAIAEAQNVKPVVSLYRNLTFGCSQSHSVLNLHTSSGNINTGVDMKTPPTSTQQTPTKTPGTRAKTPKVTPTHNTKSTIDKRSLCGLM